MVAHSFPGRYQRYLLVNMRKVVGSSPISVDSFFAFLFLNPSVDDGFHHFLLFLLLLLLLLPMIINQSIMLNFIRHM